LPLTNLPGLVGQAITEWFATLLIAALNPTLDLLGHTLWPPPT
jgi:hypothetical protein